MNGRIYIEMPCIKHSRFLPEFKKKKYIKNKVFAKKRRNGAEQAHNNSHQFTEKKY